MKKEIKKKQWICKCGQENGKGFNLFQKCLNVRPKKTNKPNL